MGSTSRLISRSQAKVIGVGQIIAGSLPAASGRKMWFTGTTVLRVDNGKIAEEIDLDDGVTALQQLGILKTA